MSVETVVITVNGRTIDTEVPAHYSLLRWLRASVHAYEVKEGCGEGVCGACTVLVDGRSVASCCVLAAQVNGADVTTSRGLIAADGSLGTLQEAFWVAGAAQCGFCTGGMMTAAHELLESEATPSREMIREALHGNLCRCTGYQAIVDAVEAASKARVSQS